MLVGEILEAAVRLFYEKGYASTSMIEIAAELGMSGSSIYRHFESKQELLEIAIRESATTKLSQTQEEIMTIAKPAARVDAIVKMFIEINITDRALTGLVWREVHYLSPETQEWVHSRTNEFAQEWASILRKARPELSKDQSFLMVRSAMRLCQAAFHSPETVHITDLPSHLEPIMRAVLATQF